MRSVSAPVDHTDRDINEQLYIYICNTCIHIYIYTRTHTHLYVVMLPLSMPTIGPKYADDRPYQVVMYSPSKMRRSIIYPPLPNALIIPILRGPPNIVSCSERKSCTGVHLHHNLDWTALGHIAVTRHSTSLLTYGLGFSLGFMLYL